MIERSENSTSSDAVASRCSQGGEEPMAIAARSHDGALLEEQCEWLRREIGLSMYFSGANYYRARDIAKNLVEEFRGRFR